MALFTSDSENLEYFIQEAVAKKYDLQDEIKVEVDYECSPKTDEKGWKEFNGKKFVDC